MKDDLPYLRHILEAIDKILAYAKDGKAVFMSDARTQDAVVRNIEVIGEAAKNVSSSLKKANPNIPWRTMAGMRDKVIHRYFNVDLNVVWRTVERDLPSLRDELANLIQGMIGPEV